jgi:hypothetical protein
VQALIEKELIDEFVKIVFTEEQLYNYFRPYIEEIYDFTRLSDQDISHFLQNIRLYLPE